MFRFLEMMGTHEERKVATYDKDGIFIDTCMITDSNRPYETAVEHPKYNNGTMIIVEMYDTKEDAQKGHDRWVEKMTAKELPKSIKDISTCDVVKFGHAIGVDLNEEHTLKD